MLRTCEIPYIPIRKGVKLVIGGSTIKYFDFIVSAYPKIYMVVLKAKSYPAISPNRTVIYWDNSVTCPELEGLIFWNNEFQKKVKGLFVFLYVVKRKTYLKDFEDIYLLKNRYLGIVALPVEEYLNHLPSDQVELMHHGRKDIVVGIAPKKFKSLVKPLSSFLPELKLILKS
jgi:hypothetical protein